MRNTSKMMIKRALGLGLFCGAALVASPAHAEIDIGVFGGAHFFSSDGKLGLRGLPADATQSQAALQHTGIFGLRISYLPIPRLAIEGELGIAPTQTTGKVFSVAGVARDLSQYQYAVLPIRVHALFNILTGRVRPFVLVGGGMHIGSPIGLGPLQTDVVGAIHAGGGLMVDLGKSQDWGLRLDGRAVLPQGNNNALTAEGEVLFSIYSRFGVVRPIPKPTVVDTDGDGTPNDQDRCPSEVGPTFNAGCPDRDTDGDGVVDRLDKCLAQVGPAENGGCPDKDSDGDGVVDRLDKCPQIAGIRETAGCPDKDSDGDGILDHGDRCPNEAGVADNGGCPDKDSDGDGVVDRLDKCPQQAETKNNYQDDDGCPDEIPQAVQQFTGAIQGIGFQANQAVITKASFPILDKALAVLKEHTSVKLEISGHTDSSGDKDKNTALSQARAEAVRKYFIDKGVAAERLTAKGYGPEKPVADNATKAGREKNRRVEFTLVK